MAKSMRCKRVKRLRALKREMIEPYYEKQEAAKLAAQEAALNAPKVAVKTAASSSMEAAPTEVTAVANPMMDVEMDDDNEKNDSLKALGGVGKKSKRQFKVGKRGRHSKGRGKGKGKVKRRHI